MSPDHMFISIIYAMESNTRAIHHLITDYIIQHWLESK